jgi:rod shape-determining protein MreD
VSIRFIRFISSRWTRLVLVASVVLGLQTTLFNDLRPFGVMAQVMVLFAACAGVIYGAEIGAVAGLIVGLMYDCVLTTPLGLASLVLGATALVAGAFPYFVRESSWWNKAIAVAVASAFGEILFPVAQALVGLGGWVQWRVIGVALIVALLNLFLAPLLMPVVRWTLKESLVG